jgi:HEAT repeat protein
VSDLAEIYVNLLDENVAVRRPVQAEHVHDNVYRIVDQPYDRAVETWQFKPGDEVVCEPSESGDGRILAALRFADRSSEAPNRSGDASEDAIIAELRSDRTLPPRRRVLVKKLRRTGTEASVPALRELLPSKDINLAVDAVLALAWIGSDDAVDALTDCLEMEPEPKFTLAASSLMKLRSRRAVPALIRCLGSRSGELDAGQRRLVVLALGVAPHVRAVPVLSLALRDANYRVRNAAAWSLAQIRAPESDAALAAAASELSWFQARPIRRAARVRKRRADSG